MTQQYRKKKLQKQISEAMKFTQESVRENKKPIFRIKYVGSNEFLESMYQGMEK